MVHGRCDLIHVREGWRGDFFLLTGAYHTIYQRHQDVGTYCSISHPWRLREALQLHEQRSMLWLGFRHAHSFIRIRLLDPGGHHAGRNARGDAERMRWLDERRAAFLEAIATLELPIETHVEKDAVVLRPSDPTIPFFCSWPDAFGPCQFEYNTSDAFGVLGAGPASSPRRLRRSSAGVRAYLTGFSEEALTEFQAIDRSDCRGAGMLAARSICISPSTICPEVCWKRFSLTVVSTPRCASFRPGTCCRKATTPRHHRHCRVQWTVPDRGSL